MEMEDTEWLEKYEILGQNYRSVNIIFYENKYDSFWLIASMSINIIVIQGLVSPMIFHNNSDLM